MEEKKEVVNQEVLDWDVVQVVEWLDKEKLEEAIPMFVEEQVDGAALVHLRNSVAFDEFFPNVKGGLRMKVISSVRNLVESEKKPESNEKQEQIQENKENKELKSTPSVGGIFGRLKRSPENSVDLLAPLPASKK